MELSGKHRFVQTNNVTLHVVEAGPADGPLLIFLHGFPEFYYGWRRQIPFFAAAGFRVWAPDQRGYNLSDKPEELAAYNLDELACDVVGLIDAAGARQAMLVGHDWGGAVAWWTANRHPERLSKLAVLNAPHHAVMARTVRAEPSQRRKSWYMLYFQLPWLPEATMRANNWSALAATLRDTSRMNTFTAADLDAYRRAWAQPGAFTAMVNWYRAVARVPPQRAASPRITVPTLLLWGKQDRFFDWDIARPSVEMCDDGRLVFFPEATHWLQHEEAPRVNQHLLDFLRAGSA